jgi:hypothetical protein
MGIPDFQKLDKWENTIVSVLPWQVIQINYRIHPFTKY